MAHKVSVCGIKNSWGWRIIEKKWWNTLSAQPERVCLHNVIQGQIRTAVWRANSIHCPPRKDNTWYDGRLQIWHLSGFHCTQDFLNCNIFLNYWPVESRRHWSEPPHTRIFSLHFHTLVPKASQYHRERNCKSLQEYYMTVKELWHVFLDGTYHIFKLIFSTNKQPIFLLVCSDRTNTEQPWSVNPGFPSVDPHTV